MSAPTVVDRAAFQAQLDDLRVREKAHTYEGDAIAAARRRLPMVEVDAEPTLVGAAGAVSLIDTLRGQVTAVRVVPHVAHGHPAAEQCEGCTFNTGHVLELSYLHSRDVTYATFCQGPYDESSRYRDFMGWEMPWYSVPEESAERADGRAPLGMQVCYLRDGDRVFETYWTTARGCEIMGYIYGMLDMTVYGRQEEWEDSPEGWPRHWGAGAEHPYRANGRPTAQWSRLASGRSDDLGAP